MVEDGSFSHNIDKVTILNLEGHPNGISGLRVKEIFFGCLDFAIGGASAVEGLQYMGLPHVVFLKVYFI